MDRDNDCENDESFESSALIHYRVGLNIPYNDSYYGTLMSNLMMGHINARFVMLVYSFMTH